MFRESKWEVLPQITDGSLQVPPSSATALTTTDSWIRQVVLVNTTASAATFTMKDAQGTPEFLFDAYSVGANLTVVFDFDKGVKMKGGITWNQGTASALNVSIQGVVLP